MQGSSMSAVRIERTAHPVLQGGASADKKSEDTVDWLRKSYGQFEFWLERDLVWTLQTRLRTVITERRNGLLAGEVGLHPVCHLQ
jgi:hypothetical protein